MILKHQLAANGPPNLAYSSICNVSLPPLDVAIGESGNKSFCKAGLSNVSA